eukprot:TRINITY_DN8826_c0_g1_i11.p1 TRINITY_DN8826_c0_g1~~TRINITY_DN8826_c0_g1_i11.p1  ORF type:complete len:110 (-),score=29.37 TRINITY_DN8826_c0_g1_i11:336-665(-)
MFFVVFYFFHIFFLFFFSSRRRHTRSVSAFLLNRSSDLRSEADAYDLQRIESACRLALEIRSTTLNGIRTILLTEADLRPRALAAPSNTIHHDNIRGPGYYDSTPEPSL